MPLTEQDEKHLDYLVIANYIMAVLAFLGACIPLIYVALGLAVLHAPESMSSETGEPAPQALGWVFTAIGAVATGEVTAAMMGRNDHDPLDSQVRELVRMARRALFKPRPPE